MSYFTDTLKWHWEIRWNGKIMIYTLHLYLNQGIKASNQYSYREAWSIAEQFEEDGLVYS